MALYIEPLSMTVLGYIVNLTMIELFVFDIHHVCCHTNQAKSPSGKQALTSMMDVRPAHDTSMNGQYDQVPHAPLDSSRKGEGYPYE